MRASPRMAVGVDWRPTVHMDHAGEVVKGVCADLSRFPQRMLFEVFVLPCALTLLLPTSHNLSANVLIIIK